MNQVPCVPICNPTMVPQQQYMPVQQPVQQPNYNAVKIDILNPTVGTPGAAPAQYASQYPQPTAPIYNYPQAPVYNYPQNLGIPVSQYPQAAPQPFPAVCIPQYPSSVSYPTTQVGPSVNTQPNVVMQPQPEINQPQVINQPTPIVVQQQNNNSPVVAQPEQQVPVVPAPQVSQPEVVPPANIVPQLDVNSFVGRLANPDFDTQASVMEDIATIIKDRKNTNRQPDAIQSARTLIDSKIYDELNNIINFDSSALEGPTQAQLDARQKILTGQQVTAEEEKLANTMTSKEQAERNKSYALFTLAIMNEMYADEVSQLPESSKPMLTELPKINVLVDQLKDNPNPMVRSSAIEALSYIQCPEYKKDLTTLFTVAKNDQDSGVANAAQAALDKLESVA